jgi:hypothetical protein
MFRLSNFYCSLVYVDASSTTCSKAGFNFGPLTFNRQVDIKVNYDLTIYLFGLIKVNLIKCQSSGGVRRLTMPKWQGVHMN